MTSQNLNSSHVSDDSRETGDPSESAPLNGTTTDGISGYQQSKVTLTPVGHTGITIVSQPSNRAERSKVYKRVCTCCCCCLLFLVILPVTITLMVNGKGYRAPMNESTSTNFENRNLGEVQGYHDRPYERGLPTTPRNLPKGKREICQSEACNITVSELLSSLNTSVDPCDNFYEFACQGWQQNNPRPNYMSKWNVFEKLKDKTNKEVIEILEEPIKHQNYLGVADPLALQQAKAFYKKCRDHDGATALSQMWDILEEYGGWPLLYPEGTWDSSRFSWMKSVAALKRRFDRVIILDVVSYQSPVGVMSGNSIVLKPAVIIRAGREGIAAYEKSKVAGQAAPALPSALQAIVDFIVNVSRELMEFKGETNINITALEKMAFQTIVMQAELFDVSQKTVDRRLKGLLGLNNTHIDTTLNRLQLTIDLYLSLMGLGPEDNQMRLKEFLTLIYSEAGVYIGNTESVFVADVDYMLGVSVFVSNFKPEALANFLQFQMALELASLSTGKMKEYVKTLKAALIGVTEEQPENTHCVDIAQEKFHHALGYAYIQKKHPDFLNALSITAEASTLFKNVKKQLLETVISSYNMYYDKPSLQLKVMITSLCVGFPSWIYEADKMQREYEGLTMDQYHTYVDQYLGVNAWLVDKELKKLRGRRDIIMTSCDWSRFVGMVGAFNEMKSFTVYVPMGILQEPYFNTDSPNAINYGRLGMILGHELAHGLHQIGWTHFQDGTLNPNADCFVRQYNEFTTSELSQENVSLNGTLTMVENIADHVGLLQAFKAYQSLPFQETRLDTLSPYTNDQLFFLSFAQNWCESNTKEVFRQALKSDRHSPGMFRVLGTLRNSEEFARAWRCPAGSNMNPSQAMHRKCAMLY